MNKAYYGEKGKAKSLFFKAKMRLKKIETPFDFTNYRITRN